MKFRSSFINAVTAVFCCENIIRSCASFIAIAESSSGSVKLFLTCVKCFLVGFCGSAPFIFSKTYLSRSPKNRTIAPISGCLISSLSCFSLSENSFCAVAVYCSILSSTACFFNAFLGSASSSASDLYAAQTSESRFTAGAFLSIIFFIAAT